MKRHLFSFGLIVLPLSALSIDHNNIDSGRPLRFEDAYSIALGEKALEFGFSNRFLRGRSTQGLHLEFKEGVRLNQDFGIGVELKNTGGGMQIEHAEMSSFWGIQRETDRSPALGVKFSLGTSPEHAKDLEWMGRFVVTRTLRQYDRLHLNLDLQGSQSGKGSRWGAVLGYSTPLGYPTVFDTTLVAEVFSEQSELNRDDHNRGIGFGIRKQVTNRSVFDFGIRFESNDRKTATLLNFGYSASF